MIVRPERNGDVAAIGAVTAAAFENVAPQYFLAPALSGPMASGMVSYHSAFYGGAAEIIKGE